MSTFRKYAIELYGFINKIAAHFGFKIDYIWPHRYNRIRNLHITTILDVWANKGQSVERRTMLLWNNIYFHCFEPLIVPFQILTEKYGNQKNISLHNIGLGSDNAEHEIFVSNIDDSSSLLAPTETMTKTYEHIHFDEKDTITIKTLDSIFKNLDIQGNVLMKIDTQGYELEVLKGGQASLKNIAIIIVELSFTDFYQDQPLFGDVHDYLSKNGFQYYGSFEQSADPADGKPLQQDAIFINNQIK